MTADFCLSDSRAECGFGGVILEEAAVSKCSYKESRCVPLTSSAGTEGGAARLCIGASAIDPSHLPVSVGWDRQDYPLISTAGLVLLTC